MTEKLIQVVEVGDALHAMSKALQEWADDGFPQSEPGVVAIPFDIPASQVLTLVRERTVSRLLSPIS